MIRVNNPPFHSLPTTHIYSSSIDGKYTYKYENNLLTIIEEDKNVFEPNQAWQTRITYRTYKE